MTAHAVITAVGPDHPGLVDAMSAFILDRDCNLEDSRMAVLGGEFAMLILVSGSAADIAALIEATAEAGREAGLVASARETNAPGKGEEVVPYKLTAFAMDHPGIVRQVARHLGERGINVRALDTELSYAPVSGQPLFSLKAVIDLPASVKVMELRHELEEIGLAENIDLELHPAR